MMVALALRLEQVRLMMPRDLAGTIQFEIERARGETFIFHVALAGAKSAIEPRAAEEYETVVCGTDGAIEAMLRLRTECTSKLEVWGDASLASRFFTSLASTPQAQSWLGIRGLKK